MRRTTTALVIAVVAGAALASPAAAGAPSRDLQPQTLTRGPDIAVPHIEDGYFVDGERRIELPGTVARVIGPSMGGWMVGTHRTNAVGERRGGRVVHVLPGDEVRTVLRDVDPADISVSEDGSSLLGVPDTGRSRAKVTVWAPIDGSVVATRTFRGHPEVVTADGAKALVRTATRTFWWNFARNEVRRPLTTRLTGPASSTHDLLTTFTRDPYLGGCTRVVRLSRPKVKRWSSCADRVAAFSPDGTQMLTYDILTDGLGPGAIRLRNIDGTLLATWTTGWFSAWSWESPGTVLLETNGRRKAAVVRCTTARCENATDPVDATAP